MKRILVLGAALAAFAAPAFANTDSEDIHIRGRVPAVCHANASDNHVNIGNMIENSTGFLRAGLQADIIAALNGAGVTAWCNGTGNSINLYRTPLARDGNNGETVNGFATAVGYDVGIDVASVPEPDGINDGFSYDEGTSDGQGAGPGAAAPFGPTGPGAPVNFVADSWDGFATAYANPAPVSGQSASYTGASPGWTNMGATRPVAGVYRSTVTLVVTAGP